MDKEIKSYYDKRASKMTRRQKRALKRKLDKLVKAGKLVIPRA